MNILPGDRCAFASFIALAVATSINAQFAPLGTDQEKLLTAEAVAAAKSIEQDLTGLGFAPGVAAVWISGDRPVETATSENGGPLNVKRKSNVRVGGIFEAHILVERNPELREAKTAARISPLLRTQMQIKLSRADTPPVAADVITRFACGPMVAVEVGENVARSLGVGVLFAWRRYEIVSGGKPTFKSPAFNLGFLVLVDPNVKTLAPGLTAGQPVPTGMTVRLDDEARLGCAFVFSAGF